MNTANSIYPVLFVVICSVGACFYFFSKKVAFSSGGSKTNSDVWVAKRLELLLKAVVVIGIVGFIAMKALDFDQRRTARLEAQEEVHKLNQEIRKRANPSSYSQPGSGATPKTMQEVHATGLQSSQPVIIPTLSATEKLGLRNAKGFPMTLTTNWTAGMIRFQQGTSFRIEPEGFPAEVRINGREIWHRIPGIPAELPRGTKFLEYRATNTTSPTNIIVWVGKLLNR